jgi:HD-like signal output (HDOD) protein
MITALSTDAESAGIWAGADFLRYLQEQAALGDWSVFKTCGEFLEFASRLIFCQLNPSYAPDCMCSEVQRNEAKEAVERARWEHIDVDRSGPVLDGATLKKQIDGLAGCPVADSAAAAFEMVADGRADTMSHLMDLVSCDPGLTAQVLAAANRLNAEGFNDIDDARAGASLLGEQKLKALAKTLPTAFERHIDLPPLSWANFWLYQVAVGRLSQWVCSYLEFDYLASSAYTAGLLQDIGKLLLLKLHPFGLQAIVRHAREGKMPLADAERKYLGCTTRDLGVHLADTQRLPAAYANVIRWVETPALATQHMDLVAIVSVARHVCLHAHVGCSGDTVGSGSGAIAAMPAWEVLKPRLFPSFDVKKFEVQACAFCLTVRSELSGQRNERLPSRAQRVAEAV